MFDKDNLFLCLNVVFLNETACYTALTEQDKHRSEQTIQSGGTARFRASDVFDATGERPRRNEGVRRKAKPSGEGERGVPMLDEAMTGCLRQTYSGKHHPFPDLADAIATRRRTDFSSTGPQSGSGRRGVGRREQRLLPTIM